MAYTKRHDGRKPDETRPITAKAGIIPQADGSGYFKIGNTEAIAAVYGPKDLHPRFMQDPKQGLLRCTYNMMPFAGQGDRVRPGPSRRSKEISMVIQKALRPVVDLSKFPNAVARAIGHAPERPAALEGVMEAEERITILDQDLEKIQDYIRDHGSIAA